MENNELPLNENLEEKMKSDSYKIQYNRDFTLFSSINIRYEKDFLLGVMPELENGTLKETLNRIKKRELSLISGVILILDKYDSLGPEHRCNMDYSVNRSEQSQEIGEHIGMLIGNQYNPEFYRILEEIFERSEGADWFVADRHFG
jgi:hypothetical protein